MPYPNVLSEFEHALRTFTSFPVVKYTTAKVSKVFSKAQCVSSNDISF